MFLSELTERVNHYENQLGTGSFWWQPTRRGEIVVGRFGSIVVFFLDDDEAIIRWQDYSSVVKELRGM